MNVFKIRFLKYKVLGIGKINEAIIQEGNTTIIK